MTRVFYCKTTTVFEAYAIVFRDNKTDDELAEILNKYHNIEIMETAEKDIVKVEALSDKELDYLIRAMKHNN